MEIPYGIVTTKGTIYDYVLQLLANIYGQKLAWRVWKQLLVKKLESIGFVQSNIDKCIFYRDGIIFIVYVDDVIFLGQSDEQLTGIIKELMGIDLKVEEPWAPSRLCGCKYQAPICTRWLHHWGLKLDSHWLHQACPCKNLHLESMGF